MYYLISICTILYDIYICMILYDIYICITYQVDVAGICGPTKKDPQRNFSQKKRTEFFMWLLARLIWSLQSGALKGSRRCFLETERNRCNQNWTFFFQPLLWRGNLLVLGVTNWLRDICCCCCFFMFFFVHMFLFFCKLRFWDSQHVFSPSFRH